VAIIPTYLIVVSVPYLIILSQNYQTAVLVTSLLILGYDATASSNCCGWFGSSTPSQKYASRSGRGDVVCSFPATVEGSLLNNNWREHRQTPLSVKMYEEHDALVTPYKFMFQKSADKAYGEHCLCSSFQVISVDRKIIC